MRVMLLIALTSVLLTNIGLAGENPNSLDYGVCSLDLSSYSRLTDNIYLYDQGELSTINLKFSKLDKSDLSNHNIETISIAGDFSITLLKSKIKLKAPILVVFDYQQSESTILMTQPSPAQIIDTFNCLQNYGIDENLISEAFKRLE